MDPSIWGEHAWFFMHTITFTYPKNPTETDKQHMYNFFMTLQYILPCEHCKTHYKNHLYQNPITPYLESRKSLVMWLIDLHNRVNRSLNKPVQKPKKILEYYKKIYANKQKKTVSSINTKSIIYFIIASILCYLLYKYYKNPNNKKIWIMKGGSYAIQTIKRW